MSAINPHAIATLNALQARFGDRLTTFEMISEPCQRISERHKPGCMPFFAPWALLVELSASNDRIDRLERHIAELRGVPLDDVRNAHSDATADAERLAATEALMVRALRILIDPRTTVDGRPKARHQAGA